MNLTKAAVLFVLITIPFYLISYVHTVKLNHKVQDMMQYSELIGAAVADGTQTMKAYAQESVGDGSTRGMPVDAEAVVEAFLATYHYGLKAYGSTNEALVDQYLVALVVVDYDGFYIYGMTACRDGSGQALLKHTLSEKVPYLYETASMAVAVTLDDQVTVIDKTSWQSTTGPVASMPMINQEGYDLFRQRVIRDAVQNRIRESLLNHSQYGLMTGNTYDFYMPIGDKASWGKGLNDPGLMVILEGRPFGDGTYFDVMSFNQGDLHGAKALKGYEDAEGHLYYCEENCTITPTDAVVEVFPNAKAAAEAGYYPYP